MLRVCFKLHQRCGIDTRYNYLACYYCKEISVGSLDLQVICAVSIWGSDYFEKKCDRLLPHCDPGYLHIWWTMGHTGMTGSRFLWGFCSSRTMTDSLGPEKYIWIRSHRKFGKCRSGLFLSDQATVTKTPSAQGVSRIRLCWSLAYVYLYYQLEWLVPLITYTSFIVPLPPLPVCHPDRAER